MNFLRHYQLSIMLILSAICGMLAFFVFISKTMPPKRKRAMILMTLGATFLLAADRYAYIYRGDTSELGWWMVRISNFLVYALTLETLFSFNLYLTDLFTNEGGLAHNPRRLALVNVLIVVDVCMLIVSQFNNFYYYFDEFNRYHRAGGFIFCYAIPFAVLVLQGWVIVQYYSRINRGVRISILLFAVVPIIATFIQIFSYGLSLTNMSIVGEIILLYVFVLRDMDKMIQEANNREIELLKEGQKNMQLLFEQTTQALASAIDAKDAYTHGHSNRVADYSRKIAERAGESKEECDEIYFAALLHDVGKIGVPSSIINKAGRLTDEEFAEIKKHPVIGKQILSRISRSPYLSIGANYHHERYDGRGYPEGLKGNDIPKIARIISVADSYDAMTSKRSYREPVPQDKAREEIFKGIGIQFDPDYAKIMLSLIDEDTKYLMKERAEVAELAGRNELLCEEYRSSVSEGIHIDKNVTKIHLHVLADQEHFSEKSYPSFILFDSLDARIPSNDSQKVDMNYSEYGTVRFDGLFECKEARKITCDIVEGGKSRFGRNEFCEAGITYEISAAKFKDHALLQIKDEKHTQRFIIALPDSSRFVYLGLTGEYCKISDVEISKSDEVIDADYIPRIAEEISFIKGEEGDLPNVQIDGWCENSTKPLLLTDELHFSFHTVSLPTARLIWHCPFVNLYYSDDQLMRGPNYQVIALIRLDGENWESVVGETEIQVTMTDAFLGWEKWKELNKAGYDVSVSIQRKGKTITLSTENFGISINSVTTLPNASMKVYVALTGDQVVLTNIRLS
ncbi:MAG: HD domain-containing protein [Treponema sp.]|nr:HD domain-containing protein [Treponema sp.]